LITRKLGLGAEGWLLGPFPEQTLWQPLTSPKFAMADWNVISSQTANIITVIAVSSTALLLNASATELETKQDIDLNKELRLAGIGNLLSCFSPGFVGFRQLSLTTLNFRMRAQSRAVGLIGASIIILTLFCGASIISYFPKIIMGGVLMYLGLNFLVEWAYETWFTLPKVDFAIIWLVLLVIATVGFMPGVAVGLVAAVIMFVVSYSRTEVVRHVWTGKNYHSMVPRRSDQRKILETKGGHLYILQLQGFIFFGTANRLFKQIKKRLGDISKSQTDCIVLDFQRVDVLDSTGMLSFRKLKDLVEISQTHLVITAASLKIYQQLIKGGLSSSHALIHYFPSLNAGIEWWEEQMLKQTGEQFSIPVSLAEQLSTTLSEKDDIKQLLGHLERIEIDPETIIIREGDVADDLFLIESGRVTTRMRDSSDSFLHMETMKNGRVVGDIGFYLGDTRTADVITTERCVMYRLSNKSLIQVEKENPKIASMLHQVMVRLLAERVTQLVKTVNSLQKND
jgi:SulP family sulfate permease